MTKRLVKRFVSPEEDKATVLEPLQFKQLLLGVKHGPHSERNLAIVWHSFGSGLRVADRQFSDTVKNQTINYIQPNLPKIRIAMAGILADL